jgi:hypothetical protein
VASGKQDSSKKNVKLSQNLVEGTHATQIGSLYVEGDQASYRKYNSERSKVIHKIHYREIKVVTMKFAVFWNAMPCSFVDFHREPAISLFRNFGTYEPKYTEQRP